LAAGERGSDEQEGKKGELTEGERWPQAWTPKIYDRWPPFPPGLLNNIQKKTEKLLV